MSFDGDELQTCIALPFARTECIIVTGDFPNPCGHAMLFTDGHYFHISGVYKRPKHMEQAGYEQYLAESGKQELGRYRRPISLPASAFDQATANPFH